MMAELPCFVPQVVFVTATDHENLDIRMPRYERREGTEEHPHAFAGFVEAPEKQHGFPRARITGQKRCPRECGEDFDSGSVPSRLGISTASPPRASTCQRRASSDTAILPLIFSW